MSTWPRQGRRAAALLADLLRESRPVHKVFRQLPFLIPATTGCTLAGPAKEVDARLADLERQPGVTHLSMACGFNPSDVPHCGPSIVAYGTDKVAVEAAADRLFQEVLDREAEFKTDIVEPRGCRPPCHCCGTSGMSVRSCLLMYRIIMAAAPTSDGMAIFAELVRQGAENAVVGLVVDPEAAALAHAAGLGAKIAIDLGGKSCYPGHQTLSGQLSGRRFG